MLKNVLLAGALLIPVLAYGANPSTDLSVQIVPAASPTPPPPSPTPPPLSNGTCGAAPVGDAAADVSAAGFTTCALYSDFTTAIPNTVGTGLPGELPPQNNSGTPNGNWIDCNEDNATNVQWYWGNSSSYYGGAPPCSYITQGVDPDYPSGGLALILTVPPGGSGWTLNTTPWNFQTASAYNWNFPDAIYVEAQWRNDLAGGTFPSSSGGNFWSPATAPNSTCSNGIDNPGGVNAGYQSQEIDFVELGGGNSNPGAGYMYGNTTAIMWGNSSSGCGSSGYRYQNGYAGVSNSDIAITQYTTIGELITQDGNGNFATCTYLNGVRDQCNGPYTGPVSYNTERRNIQLDSGDTNSTSANQVYYIKYVKVISCRNWLTTGQTCAGSGSNGTFYTGAGG